MSKKGRKNISGLELTDKEIKEAAAKMMAGAQAHQHASKYCLENLNAKLPNIDGVFFPVVAFELILNSIEQSLRLTLLIHYSILKPVHNIFALYKTVLRKSLSKEGMRSEIVSRVNVHVKSWGMEVITEKDICRCLRKHDSSYSNFRYFGLDDEGRSTKKWEMTGYEIKLLHCFALALLKVNFAEMRKRGIKTFGAS